MGMVKLLIAARDLANYKRGDIVSIRGPDSGWGKREVPPDYVRINISDLTTEQHFETIKHYNKPWVVDYTREYLGNQADGRKRFLIKVDPSCISASGNTRKDMKQKFEAWFPKARLDPDLVWHGCTIVSYDAQNNGVILDIPPQADMEVLQDDFRDFMKEAFEKARYKLVGGALSTIITAGGEITETKAVVKNYIRDKLDD